MQKFVEVIKKVALDAVRASKPVSIVYGTVQSVSPLKIQLEQKLSLDEDFLLLTKNVISYEAVGTTTTGNHTHEVKVTIDNSLKKDDRVILEMIQGGQKYIVWDKVV
jgi:hypothetical protein